MQLSMPYKTDPTKANVIPACDIKMDFVQKKHCFDMIFRTSTCYLVIDVYQYNYHQWRKYSGDEFSHVFDMVMSSYTHLYAPPPMLDQMKTVYCGVLWVFYYNQ